MKPLFLLLVLFSCWDAHAQISLIGLSRAEAEKKLRKEDHTAIIQTDSTFSYSLHCDSQTSITVTCHFSEEERCAMISFTSGDSASLQNYLSGVLSWKKYSWKKINGNQYVSKYRKKLLLETDPDISKRSFRILPAQWTRETYRNLTFD